MSTVNLSFSVIINLSYMYKTEMKNLVRAKIQGRNNTLSSSIINPPEIFLWIKNEFLINGSNNTSLIHERNGFIFVPLYFSRNIKRKIPFRESLQSDVLSLHGTNRKFKKELKEKRENIDFAVIKMYNKKTALYREQSLCYVIPQRYVKILIKTKKT